jgi:transcriptional regulator with XRE-family HTH domain
MKKIRAWRKERNITIDAAGELLGVSGVQWSRYETGKRRVPAESVLALSKLTGIPAHELRPDVFPVPSGPSITEQEHAA